MDSRDYCIQLINHLESYYKVKGTRKTWEYGPVEKVHPEFFILEFPPNQRHNAWAYCTVGMSLDRQDDNLIEAFIYSPRQDVALLELLSVTASYHRNSLPLNLNHTVNIGQSWIDESVCDHGLLSLPYLDGEDLELFQFNGETIHCYWFIPITERERDYKIEEGIEALEQLFEEKQLDYLNPKRICLLRHIY
jgi:hypothetical protein